MRKQIASGSIDAVDRGHDISRTVDPWVRIGERVEARVAIDARVRRAARGYASLGVGPGDVVAVCMRNDFSFLEPSLAAGLCGAYANRSNHSGKGSVA